MSEISLTGSHLGQLPLTNTLFTSMVVVGILLFVSFWATRNMRDVPGTLQNIVEFAIETLYDLVASITDNARKTRIFFPLVATLFFYIAAANYFGLLPGVGTIGFMNGGQLVPILRSPASDLNLTLTLALFSVIATHYYSIRELGLKGYLAIWFSFNPILLFVGLLELVAEFTKIVSLSFRLFGNIYAGETVLEVVGRIFTPFLAPLPFLGLELIVSFVQALVFSMLTLASMVLLTSHHSDEEHA